MPAWSCSSSGSTTTSFLGASVEANGSGAKSLMVSFTAYLLLVPAVVFLVVSRSWRALPPVRRRT